MEESGNCLIGLSVYGARRPWPKLAWCTQEAARNLTAKGHLIVVIEEEKALMGREVGGWHSRREPCEWLGPMAWLQGGHDRGCWREQWEEWREETVSGLGGCIKHMELKMDTFWFLALELSFIQRQPPLP